MKKSNLFTLFLAVLLFNTFSSYACENTPPTSPIAFRKKMSVEKKQSLNMAQMLLVAAMLSSSTIPNSFDKHKNPLVAQDVNSPVLGRKSPTKKKKK